MSDTSIARNLHLPGLEKKSFSDIRTNTHFFGSDFGICVAQNQVTFEDQSFIIEIKKIFALINDWENDNAKNGKNPSKAKP